VVRSLSQFETSVSDSHLDRDRRWVVTVTVPQSLASVTGNLNRDRDRRHHDCMLRLRLVRVTGQWPSGWQVPTQAPSRK
jgi:hypothetical protein